MDGYSYLLTGVLSKNKPLNFEFNLFANPVPPGNWWVIDFYVTGSKFKVGEHPDGRGSLYGKFAEDEFYGIHNGIYQNNLKVVRPVKDIKSENFKEKSITVHFD